MLEELYRAGVVIVDIIVLFLILKERFSSLNMIVVIGCHKWLSLACEKVLLYLFSSGFYHEWMLDSVRAFFYVNWDAHLSCFCLCDVLLIELHMLTNPCIPGMNTTWSWCMILLTHCLPVSCRGYLHQYSLKRL